MSPEANDRDFERAVSGAYHVEVPVRSLEEPALLDLVRRVPAPRRVPPWREWITRPAALTLSPLAGALAALALVGAGMWIGARSAASLGKASPPPLAAFRTAEARAQVVEFALVAPRASRVAVVGDFNGWDPAATPMRRLEGGAWTTAIAVPEGRYAYAFVINGRSWVADPTAPLAPDDGFGLKSSVLVVEGSRAS